MYLRKGLQNPTKVKTVTNWLRPTTITKVKNFLRMTGYYRCFIEWFSKIILSLTQLTKIKLNLNIVMLMKIVFKNKKMILISAPILVIPSGSREFMVYNDASEIIYDVFQCRMIELELMLRR